MRLPCAAFVSAALLFLLACSPVDAGPTGGDDPLSLLYTADAQGYLEECACDTGGELGGIARRATLVDSLRAEDPGLLLVEAGDFATSPGPRGDITALVAARAMKEMGYDAVLPGEVDLNLGGGFWQRERKEVGLPLVHTNFGTPALGPPQTEPLIVERGGRTVAVLGLLGTDLYLLPGIRDSVEVLPPVESARRALAAIEDRDPDLVVALVHMKAPEIAALADSVPEVHVLVAGHTTRNAAEPERHGSALLVTAGFLGQHVGELMLVPGDSAATRNRLHRIETTLREDPRIARWVGIAAPGE